MSELRMAKGICVTMNSKSLLTEEPLRNVHVAVNGLHVADGLAPLRHRVTSCDHL